MDTEETFFLALKSHRESKDIQIDEISDYTKINPKYLHAIEEGNFDIIPNIYMRLFLRSYAKYIDTDYRQALVDYELYTTGKIQPKFFEEEGNNLSFEKKSIINKADLVDEFQINYKQVITIVLTVIAIYLGFKLVEYISNDNNSGQSSGIIIPGSEPLTLANLDEFSSQTQSKESYNKLSLLNNQDFKNSSLEHELTKIIPLSSNEANLKIKTLNNVKINISTSNQDGSVFF